jgi:hypothetical protein
MSTHSEQMPVEMTLEESGVLCHLLLTSIMQDKSGYPQFRQRMLVLYDKLADVNDRLMGKLMGKAPSAQ